MIPRGRRRVKHFLPQFPPVIAVIPLPRMSTRAKPVPWTYSLRSLTCPRAQNLLSGHTHCAPLRVHSSKTRFLDIHTALPYVSAQAKPALWTYTPCSLTCPRKQNLLPGHTHCAPLRVHASKTCFLGIHTAVHRSACRLPKPVRCFAPRLITPQH